MRFLLMLCALAGVCASAQAAESPSIPKPAAIDAEVQRVLKDTGAKGLAIAVIDDGKVGYVKAYGVRNAKGEPLTTQTVMYGASLTKAAFAYAVMQQVDQGRLTLDTPLADMLPQPLPSYASPDIINRYSDWSALDERWRKLTPRIVLTHSSGFANFRFLEPDEKLTFHFDPGARYAYSGDGLLTLQFAMETGLGLSLRDETDRIFKGLGMTRSSLIWRLDFADNLADGWNDRGEVEAHDERSKVRVAGSMDTTIGDFARFAAAFVQGEGLSAGARADITKRQLKITTRTQFPPFQPELPADQQRADLYAGLGVVVFDGPQGHGFYKGGHNDMTANTWVCVERSKRCVVILSNDVRAEAGFAALVRFVLGETGVPYEWEYGDHAGKS